MKLIVDKNIDCEETTFEAALIHKLKSKVVPKLPADVERVTTKNLNNQQDIYDGYEGLTEKFKLMVIESNQTGIIIDKVSDDNVRLIDSSIIINQM